MPSSFTPAVAHNLGYYVYLYINPLDEQVFYVGKGKGNRAFAHLEDAGPSAKAALIAKIRASGQDPRIHILVHGLKEEETALKIEAAVIDLYPPEQLTNEVRGYHSGKHGRMTLDQINALYGATRVDISEPALLIRISKLYRHTMTPSELYDTTRGFWVVGPNREKAKLAMAVYEGVIREVYGVQAWFPAGSTFTTRHDTKNLDPDRWEFVGRVAIERYERNTFFEVLATTFRKPHKIRYFISMSIELGFVGVYPEPLAESSLANEELLEKMIFASVHARFRIRSSSAWSSQTRPFPPPTMLHVRSYTSLRIST